MGMLDILINDNKEPIQNIKYIYILDVVWKLNSFNSFPIKPFTEITQLVKTEDDSFEFKINGSDEIYRTNYGWAIIENNETNIKKYKEYLNVMKQIKTLESEANRLRDLVLDLDGPSKIK